MKTLLLIIVQSFVNICFAYLAPIAKWTNRQVVIESTDIAHKSITRGISGLFGTPKKCQPVGLRATGSNKFDSKLEMYSMAQNPVEAAVPKGGGGIPSFFNALSSLLSDPTTAILTEELRHQIVSKNVADMKEKETTREEKSTAEDSAPNFQSEKTSYLDNALDHVNSYVQRMTPSGYGESFQEVAGLPGFMEYDPAAAAKRFHKTQKKI
jgi:hypothetical protein